MTRPNGSVFPRCLYEMKHLQIDVIHFHSCMLFWESSYAEATSEIYLTTSCKSFSGNITAHVHTGHSEGLQLKALNLTLKAAVFAGLLATSKHFDFCLK